MTLSDIDVALKKFSTISEFDSWLVKNDKELSNFIYRLSGKDLADINFDKFCYESILPSLIYREYQNSSTTSEPFLDFLALISVSAEKLAEIGFDSFARTIVSDLPESQSRYRLMALNQFASVDDIRTSYFEKFPIILNFLDKSRVEFADENSRYIVDVLVYFYKKAKSAFENKNLPNKIIQLKELFRNSDLNRQYPFLSNKILVDLVNDQNPFELTPQNILRDRLEPSAEIKHLFRKINNDYFNHSSINERDNNLWGYTRKEILDNVLLRGRCDFNQPYGKITTDDKVMLYCYFNLKKHFFTSYAVFQIVDSSLGDFFNNPSHPPVFIDLGCGPLTSGLALADLMHSKKLNGISFSYIGVDRSDAMIKKAESFKQNNIFSSNSIFKFVKNWNDIDYSFLYQLAGKNNPILFNASYLFASSSIDPKDLGRFVTDISRHFANVFFIFQNPNRENRNVKYEIFKQSIKSKSILSGNEVIRYKASSNEAVEDVSYEILEIQN